MKKYDLLIIPGGAKSLEKLRLEEDVLTFISKWNAEGKVIASICHGAQMLISANVTKGKNISGYYSIKDDIINSGANFVDDKFVVDGNIISCPHYQWMGEWMKAVMDAYYNKR